MRVRAALVAVLTVALVATLLAPLAAAADETEPQPMRRMSPADARATWESTGGDDARLTPYIINGRETDEGEHPYVALILFVDIETGAVEGSCTGSLVAPRWIQTAAHCVIGTEAAVIGLDFVDVNDPDAEVRQASGVAIAPGNLNSDVALLQLDEASTVTPVPVANTADDDRYLGGTEAKIVGWGYEDGQQTATDKLLEGEISILSTDACYETLGGLFDHGSMTCGGGNTYDACSGDSGGPLLVDDDGEWLLFGATAFGDVACDLDVPTAFARMSHVRAWMTTTAGIAARPGTPRFSDLGRANRHFDAVMTIVDAGIASGLPDGTYRPDRGVTRAQMASFLTRALDLTASGPPEFPDVDPDYVHAPAIAAVAEAGIAEGYGDGTFRPTEIVSRAQMATFLARALELTASGEVRFSDVSPSSVHAPAIAAVDEAGITTGYPNGTYRPNQDVTRAQMGSFLARALDLLTLTPKV